MKVKWLEVTSGVHEHESTSEQPVVSVAGHDGEPVYVAGLAQSVGLASPASFTHVWSYKRSSVGEPSSAATARVMLALRASARTSASLRQRNLSTHPPPVGPIDA